MALLSSFFAKFGATPSQDTETRFKHVLDALTQLEEEVENLKQNLTVTETKSTANPKSSVKEVKNKE